MRTLRGLALMLGLALAPLAGAEETKAPAAAGGESAKAEAPKAEAPKAEAPKAEAAAKAEGKAEAKAEGKAEGDNPNRITREGVVVDLSVRPVTPGVEKPTAADWADVVFRLTDANNGEPIRGRYPAGWMDLGKAWEAKGDRPLSCRERVSTYLKGIVGVRPMIDLNSHFVLVMNRDASISVIDPAVGITGVTNLFAQVNLEKPGADWAKMADQKRIFVSMPQAGKVALVDTEAFKVSGSVEAGVQPTRAELQNDQRYLWVGNNSPKAEESGVTVIDTAKLEKVAFIPTGKGHHEIAFSDDDRYAFVTNRDGGTVSVIDIQALKKLADVNTGEKPISIAFSPQGKALYVADGKSGVISVVDPATRKVRARIKAKPGLGPMRFSQDGRWAIVVNPFENKAYVLDAIGEKLAHTVEVGKQPYQVTFTRAYAYIRSLATERVGLIPVTELAKREKPPITYIQAGQNPPGTAGDISIADAMVPSAKEAAAYIVNQAEGTVHFYMEGMTAPAGAFRNYGHQPRAIEIVDRSLQELEPGVYSGRVKIPVAGSYDVAFMMDTPRFLHCFSAEVVPNPEVRTTKRIGVEYQIPDRRVPVGSSAKVKFTLIDPANGQPMADIPDVTVLYYRADGRGRTVVPAKSLGNGLYEAEVKVGTEATYYVYVGAQSKNLKHSELPFASLMGVPPPKEGK